MQSGICTQIKLNELTCTTVRDAQGKALRYAATFADKSADPMRYLVVTTESYSGDGVYAEGVYTRWEGEGLLDDFFTSLTLSNGGKHGVGKSADGKSSFEFDCDAQDDTDPTATARLGDPAPGTAQVAASTGEVYMFDRIECTTNPVGGGFRVDIPSFDPIEDVLDLQLNLPESNTGQQPTQLSFNYYRIDAAHGESGTSALTCNEPVTGSFEDRNTPHLLTAKFACPLR